MTSEQRVQRAVIKALEKAIRLASKKLPLASVRHRNEHLSYAADDKAEAFAIGTEEAQTEIIHRLRKLQDSLRLRPKVEGPPSFSPNFDERNGIR